MPTRRIIIYWLLLLVPTLLIGAGALKLLQHEEDRIQRLGEDVLQRRAQSVADTITLAVSDTYDVLLNSLAALDGRQDILPRMHEWRRNNPLVRNAFLWQPGKGLIYPNPNQPSTAEERRFVQRYQSLFEGDTGWLEASLRGQHDTEADSVSYWETLPSGLEINTVQSVLDPENRAILAEKQEQRQQQTDSYFRTNPSRSRCAR